jgi:hypothetical protein
MMIIYMASGSGGATTLTPRVSVTGIGVRSLLRSSAVLVAWQLYSLQIGYGRTQSLLAAACHLDLDLDSVSVTTS